MIVITFTERNTKIGEVKGKIINEERKLKFSKIRNYCIFNGIGWLKQGQYLFRLLPAWKYNMVILTYGLHTRITINREAYSEPW